MTRQPKRALRTKASRALVRIYVAGVLLFLLGIARPATAHPAGLASINRYIGVDCDGQGRVRLAYRIDFAEIPSYAEIDLLDSNKDDAVTADERRAYLDRRLPPLVAEWTVEINGVKSAPRVVASSLEILDGERGLSTLRVVAEVAIDRPAPLESGVTDVRVHVHDAVFSDHSGWREMAAQDSAGALVTEGTKAASADALAYASGAKAPRVDDMEFVFHLVSNTPSPATDALPTRAVPLDPGLARLSSAMKHASGSWLFSAIALAWAAALGAAHALSPGHGKALAAAYLVGRRARPAQAVVFGATVTLAHTLVVFLVGGLAVTIERTLGSDRLLRGLALVSAVTVVVLGLVQLSARWREVTNGEAAHGHASTREGERGVGSLVALGTSSGLAPCPSALAVLLSAMAIHRYGFGLVLVLAFSLGAALTLTTTGLLVVFARRQLDRMTGLAPLLPWLPVLSSACVLVVGILLCASAWSQ